MAHFSIADYSAIARAGGVAFRVWAPHAEEVLVTGTFNDWSEEATPLDAEESGYWYADAAEANAGDEYRFLIRADERLLSRIDPYARAVTNSVGNGIVVAPAEDRSDGEFSPPPWNALVIYEMHVGTFGPATEDEPGTLPDGISRLDHLQRLGVNAVQIMAALTPRSRTNLTASSLNSRLNFLRSIVCLLFQKTPYLGVLRTGSSSDVGAGTGGADRHSDWPD